MKNYRTPSRLTFQPRVMASAKKAAGNGTPAKPIAPTSKKAPATPPTNGSTTPSRRGRVGVIVRSTPVLYPDRELPLLPEFSNKEITNARNADHSRHEVRLVYSVIIHKPSKEEKKYTDRREGGDKNKSLLDSNLEESVSKGLFPTELVKKTVTRRKKRKANDGDALTALNKLNDNDAEEGEEEDEEGEGGEKKKVKEKKKEDEEELESEESEESDGGMDYNLGGTVDDDSEGMDDDGGGGGDDMD